MIFLLGCERGWVRKIVDPNYNGCTDKSACNYNKLSYVDDGSCVSPQGCNQWCKGDDGSALELDCANQCGGSSIKCCDRVVGVVGMMHTFGSVTSLAPRACAQKVWGPTGSPTSGCCHWVDFIFFAPKGLCRRP